MTRSGKFNAVKTVIDGITFASKAEARRYGELKLLEKAGEIEGLELQPKFLIAVMGEPIATYIGDFRYRLVLNKAARLTTPVVEDVKGFKTAAYRLKKKLVEAQYGITITEIGRATPVTQAKRAGTTRRSNAQRHS